MTDRLMRLSYEKTKFQKHAGSSVIYHHTVHLCVIIHCTKCHASK